MAKNNKLVRDLIPQKIRNNGEIPICRELSDAEMPKALDSKLLEETEEYLQAKTKTQQLEELADIKEVMLAILEFLGSSEKELEQIRIAKVQKNGAFIKKIFHWNRVIKNRFLLKY